MNNYKEYYLSHLSTVEQVFLKNTQPMIVDTDFAKICYNKCIRSTLKALQENNSKNLYSNIMGILFLYE